MIEDLPDRSGVLDLGFPSGWWFIGGLAPPLSPMDDPGAVAAF